MIIIGNEKLYTRTELIENVRDVGKAMLEPVDFIVGMIGDALRRE